MRQEKCKSGWFQEQRRIVAYPDCLSERVNALRQLHTPFGALGRVTGGVGRVAPVRVG
jgi:hypothetical protein